MRAARYAMLAAAARAFSDCSPTVVMVDTMPTGPLISEKPASPVMSIWRLRRTRRTKSTAWSQQYLSRPPKVSSWAPKYRPKPVNFSPD